ncbi:BTAD domain-containing putative transcriptional regulator [Actinomadura chibensis]|uniref:AfsR/SARP family transcriptional regulator n=1 Tax=Actinomadura chibensis TaxID=392828 RepID=A0A5D0NVJ4_9ACTN|nr:BTAD domain-containing putative transcriptional regulator [Actinomadura chibensis]TYB48262.1 AfsR/SARP family transcriptional regulator [Actinomadura chibensis]
MRFGVLGPLAAWTDHGEPVAIPGRKVRALLADLLVHEGRAVSSDRLVDDLWGDAAPADPTAALQVRVSQLRRALANAESGARDLVVSQPPGYALRAAPGAVDAARFAHLAELAQAADDPRTTAGLLTEALDLWRGPALADFADAEFARAAVTRWEERRLAAAEALAEARLALGEHRELVAELGEQVSRQPYRERLRAAHMRALYRAGRVGEALESYQDLRRGLADELGLDPSPELTALHAAILAGDPAERAPAPVPRPVRPTTNLPAPVTELIGRDHDVRRVRELLAAGRLVTLTGPGGVGKTSVAIATARAAADAYPDGVWLVDLTAWDGHGDPAEIVLSALSIPDAPGDAGTGAGARLAAALRERRTLLVLDNCEHVIEPVAGLTAALLPVAPGLRVLAASREPLRLRGEARWDVAPLDVPGTDDPDRLSRSPAVRLFLARAGLDPAPETAAAVAEVCRRLDGIPLALELAATRVPALGVAELAARLRVPRDRFGLLGTGPRDAPARQRTLAAVIDWSWRLLTGPERAVLRRLAVHSGGCTLDAAEALCAGDEVEPGQVLDLLAGLVDRSLVVRAAGPRFRLLETVSAFCHDRLREAGEEAALRRRHADHYLALAASADLRLRGPDQREWLLRLDAETANLRAALDAFHRDGAADRALRLAGTLTWYWFLRGRFAEADRVLAAALDAPGEAPAGVRAKAAAWHAGLALMRGRSGAELVAGALRDAEAVPDPVERVRAQWFLASSIISSGDETTTTKLLASALDTARAAGDRWGEAAVLSVRAMLAHMRGDLDALEHDARRGAELFAELGDEWGVLQATSWLIGLADMTGDHAAATRLARDGLRIAEDLGLWSDAADRLSWLAWTSVQVGDYASAREQGERARRLAVEQGQAGEVFATLSVAFAARRGGDLDQAEEHLRRLLATARGLQTAESSPPYLPMVLAELGLLAARRGDPATALAHHREAFATCRDQASARGMAWALTGMAEAVALDGRPGAAARLLGAAETARRGTILPPSPSDQAELDRITAAVRRAEPDFDALFKQGAELTPEQARTLADEDRA